MSENDANEMQLFIIIPQKHRALPPRNVGSGGQLTL